MDDAKKFAFSRRVIATKPHFGKDGSRKSAPPPRAVFRNLPQDRILTVSVEPPRPWLIGQSAAAVDMDNIILSKLPETEQVCQEQSLYSTLSPPAAKSIACARKKTEEWEWER